MIVSPSCVLNDRLKGISAERLFGSTIARRVWPIDQRARCAPSPTIPWLTCVPSGPRCSRIDEVRFKTSASVNIGICPRPALDRVVHTSSMAATKPHISRREAHGWWLRLRTSRRPAWNPARNMIREKIMRTGGTTLITIYGRTFCMGIWQYALLLSYLGFGSGIIIERCSNGTYDRYIRNGKMMVDGDGE